MITKNEKGDTILVLDLYGQGEYVHKLQKALVKGIEEVGCSERSGDEDYQEAVWVLSDLLRACLLDPSQTNVGLGGRPYAEKKSKAEG